MGRVTLRTRHVNWKNVTDNYSDSHAHHRGASRPDTRLFGLSYGHRGAEPWVDKMWGYLRDVPRPRNALRAPVPDRCCRASEHLPEERQRLWTYFKMWPNIAFDIYPDQIDFMQMIPVSPTETLIREIAYASPGLERREMRAARYLQLAHQPACQRRRTRP